MAVVSTVLVSRAGPFAGGAGRAARALGTGDAFHAAYWVIFAFAALGALTAAIAFPWRATRQTEAAPRRGVGSIPANG